VGETTNVRVVRHFLTDTGTGCLPSAKVTQRSDLRHIDVSLQPQDGHQPGGRPLVPKGYGSLPDRPIGADGPDDEQGQLSIGPRAGAPLRIWTAAPLHREGRALSPMH
jgi:hypothetical protein